MKVSASMTDHPTTNKPVTVASKENKNFIAINVQLIGPRDASGRSRLSILVALTHVGLAVLGSRLGM